MEARFRKPKERKRKAGNLPQRKSILIVCEGEKTEQNYFRWIAAEINNKIRPHRIAIRTVGPRETNRTDPLGIFEYAKKCKTENENFDQIWCVFDMESPNDQRSKDVKNIITSAKSRKIHLAISSPAIEFWFIIHFAYTSACMANKTEAIERLHEYWDEYADNVENFGILNEKHQTAIKNAKRRLDEAKRARDNSPVPRPSTTLHRLVDQIFKMGKKPY